MYTPVRYSTYVKCAEGLHFSAFHFVTAVRRPSNITPMHSPYSTQHMQMASLCNCPPSILAHEFQFRTWFVANGLEWGQSPTVRQSFSKPANLTEPSANCVCQSQLRYLLLGIIHKVWKFHLYVPPNSMTAASFCRFVGHLPVLAPNWLLVHVN